MTCAYINGMLPVTLAMSGLACSFWLGSQLAEAIWRWRERARMKRERTSMERQLVAMENAIRGASCDHRGPCPVCAAVMLRESARIARDADN